MTDAAEEAGWATAKTLAEALPYIQIYDRETVVIKYGGHAMGQEDVAKVFAADAVLLKLLGVHPVVVHGGGPQISRMLERAGVKSTFVDGLRVTDEATMEVAEMVLSGAINKEIANWITLAGAEADVRGVGLSGKDARMITAEKVTRTKRDPDSNIEQVVDLAGVLGQGVVEELDARRVPHAELLGDLGADQTLGRLQRGSRAGEVLGALVRGQAQDRVEDRGLLGVAGDPDVGDRDEPEPRVLDPPLEHLGDDHLDPVGHLALKAVSGQVGDGVVRHLIEGAVVQGHLRMQQRRRGMVVESQRGPVRPGKDVADQRFCFGAEGFPAQLDPVVCGQAGPQAFQRADNLPAGGDAAQARLPGQGQGMIGCGDTIGCQLAVGFQQGGLSIHGDAGAWHQLALKGIAVDIDEGRGQEPPGARHDCRSIAGHIDARDQAVFDADRGSFNPVVQDQPCAFDQLCGHASFSARKCQCQLPGLSWGRSNRVKTSNSGIRAIRSAALQK